MYEANQKIYEFENFRLDVIERQLLKDNTPVAISPKAFDLLVALVENKGRLVERESLYAMVWPDRIVEDANLTVHISTIRKSLEEASCISTVAGHGYRFNWPVEEVSVCNSLQPHALLEGVVNSEEGTELFAQPESSAELPIPEKEDTAKHVPPDRNFIVATIIGVVLVTALAVGSYIYYGRGPATQIESIAVMPFVNETGDPDLEYLSDGLTVSVISGLSKLPEISVKARTSVFRYKGTNIEMPTIGSELGVQALLSGRLVKRGDDVTLFVELIEPASEKILWSETYNRTTTNLVSLQGDIARDVSRKLAPSLSREQQQLLAKVDTARPEAYQFYLRGRYHWNKRNPEDLRKAIDYFDRAIALDPNFASAYAGVADAYALHFDYIPGDNSTETMMKGKDAALKALSLDDGSAEAHASLGLLMLQDYDFAGAEREMKRAIDLDPDSAAMRHRYGLLLRSLGRFDQMFAQYLRAVEMEPLDPLMTDVYGAGFSWARRYDEALVQFSRSLEFEPDRPIVHAWIGYAYWGKGDHARAVHHFAQAKELRGRGDVAGIMRKAFADAGWQGFLGASVKDPAILPWPYERARYYAALGQKDKAFEQLNEAYDVRESRLRNLRIDPFLDEIRDDHRYIELVRKIGFPE